MPFDRRLMNIGNRGAGASVLHTYVNTADTIATIEASGCFNPMADSIRTNDAVYYVGSNGARIGRLAKSGSNVVTMTDKTISFT